MRDYTRNFAIYYKKGIDENIQLENIEVSSNQLDKVFKFPTRHDYETFVYEDYAWELFGKCETCSKNLGAKVNNWITKDITNIDTDTPIEVIIVSAMEYGLTIPATLFFISKLGLKIREVYLPMDSNTIWDRCDALITANPHLLENKPEGKVSVKIETDYNTKANADYAYTDMNNFIEKIENVEKLIQKQ